MTEMKFYPPSGHYGLLLGNRDYELIAESIVLGTPLPLDIKHFEDGIEAWAAYQTVVQQASRDSDSPICNIYLIRKGTVLAKCSRITRKNWMDDAG